MQTEQVGTCRTVQVTDAQNKPVMPVVIFGHTSKYILSEGSCRYGNLSLCHFFCLAKWPFTSTVS